MRFARQVASKMKLRASPSFDSSVRTRTLAPGLTLGLVGLIAALIVAKFLIYVVVSQSFGGAHQALCKWDCEWYVHTIRDSYDPEPRFYTSGDFGLHFDYVNWAFFPLYPMLARVFRLATGIGAFWSGTVVSILCFFAFSVLSCTYRVLTRPHTSHSIWIVTLFVYPFSIYFFIPYSESCYLVLTLAVLYYSWLQKFSAAGAATALLTATRPTGVLVIPYLAMESVVQGRAALQRGMSLATRTRILTDAFFPLALAPLGLACYMVYLYWLTGDALAFSHVQVAWNRQLMNPLKAFYWGLMKGDWASAVNSSAGPSQTYAAACVVLAGAACLWLLSRGLFLEMWLLGSTVLLASTTGLLSMPRFVTANPVVLLVVGDLADRIRPRALRVALALAAVALQGFVLLQWFARSMQLM